MEQYKCEYTVNGVRTVQIVTARTPSEAKRLIQMQYAGCKIIWWSYSRISK